MSISEDFWTVPASHDRLSRGTVFNWVLAFVPDCSFDDLRLPDEVPVTGACPKCRNKSSASNASRFQLLMSGRYFESVALSWHLSGQHWRRPSSGGMHGCSGRAGMCFIAAGPCLVANGSLCL